MSRSPAGPAPASPPRRGSVRFSSRSHFLAAAFVAGLLWLPAAAARLPVATWTSEHGLPHDRVRKILQDSHGFLWFATAEGLARFDGDRFVVYGPEQGMPAGFIHELFEDAEGRLWVGTDGEGVCRFDPEARSESAPAGRRAAFTCAAPPGDGVHVRAARALCDDGQGGLWVGTHAGLFRLTRRDGPIELRPVPLDVPSVRARNPLIFDLERDSSGVLWVASEQGVLRLTPDGRITHLPIAPSGGEDPVRVLMFEPSGRLWIGHQGAGVLVAWPRAEPDPAARGISGGGGLFALPAPPGGPRRIDIPASALSGSRQAVHPLPARPGEARWLIPGSEIASLHPRALQGMSDGAIWIGSARGALVRFQSNGFSWFAAANGVSDLAITALAEDAAGDLWIGSDVGGAQRILRAGLIAYTREDGLGHPWITSIASDADGRLHVVSGDLEVHEFESGRFRAVTPPLAEKTLMSSGHYPALEDRDGAWWFATPEGLYRFPPIRRLEDLSRAAPVARYTSRDGLPGDHVTEIFEDAHGDIWVGVQIGADLGRGGLSRWERRTGQFHRYGPFGGAQDDGLPAGAVITAFAGSATGDVWIGLGSKGLARWRDGEFLVLGASEGIAAADIASLRVGRDGAVWAATSSGLLRVEVSTTRASAKVTRFGRGDGLASDQVQCSTEDRHGRLYAGTLKGVDRMEPGAVRFTRHYGKSDGLPNTEVYACHAASDGTIWFGLLTGLVRLDPALEHGPIAPSALVGGVRIAGEAWSISELGASEVDLGSIPAARARLAIDLVGLSPGLPAATLFQYRLSGANEEWSEPTAQRTVHYPRLVPGRYRFEARAVGPGGAMSGDLAVVSLTVQPPFWRRGWFLAGCAALVAGISWMWHRRRVARLVEMQKIRMRIATDLHDDVGSSLSQIAILSEVMRRQLTAGDDTAREPLARIAATSRELVDTMSDIVWSINPERDHLSDLIQRMRRFASDLLSARNVTFRMTTPPGDGQMRIRSEIRQQVYLVFKESLNNVVRHSGASEVDLLLELTDGRLRLSVTDNGVGFDLDAPRNGNGVDSMSRRAARLGGTLSIALRPGGGTTLVLSVPT